MKYMTMENYILHKHYIVQANRRLDELKITLSELRHELAFAENDDDLNRITADMAEVKKQIDAENLLIKNLKKQTKGFLAPASLAVA